MPSVDVVSTIVGPDEPGKTPVADMMADLLRDPAFYRDVLSWLNPWAIDRIPAEKIVESDARSDERAGSEVGPQRPQRPLRNHTPSDPPLPPEPVLRDRIEEPNAPVTLEGFDNLLADALHTRKDHAEKEAFLQACDRCLNMTTQYEETNGPFAQFLIEHSTTVPILKPLANCYEKYITDAQVRTVALLHDREEAEQRLQRAKSAVERLTQKIHDQSRHFVGLHNATYTTLDDDWDQYRCAFITALKKRYSQWEGLKDAERSAETAKERWKLNGKIRSPSGGRGAASPAERAKQVHDRLEESRRTRMAWRTAEKRFKVYQTHQLQRDADFFDGPVTEWLHFREFFATSERGSRRYEPTSPPGGLFSPEPVHAPQVSELYEPVLALMYKPRPRKLIAHDDVATLLAQIPVNPHVLARTEAAARRNLHIARANLRKHRTWWLTTMGRHMYIHPETTQLEFETDWRERLQDDPYVDDETLVTALKNAAKVYEALQLSDYDQVLQVEPSLSGETDDGDVPSELDMAGPYNDQIIVNALKKVAEWQAGPEITPDRAYKEEPRRGPRDPEDEANLMVGALADDPDAVVYASNPRRECIDRIMRSLQLQGVDVPADAFHANWAKVDREDAER